MPTLSDFFNFFSESFFLVVVSPDFCFLGGGVTLAGEALETESDFLVDAAVSFFETDDSFFERVSLADSLILILLVLDN